MPRSANRILSHFLGGLGNTGAADSPSSSTQRSGVFVYRPSMNAGPAEALDVEEARPRHGNGRATSFRIRSRSPMEVTMSRRDSRSSSIRRPSNTPSKINLTSSSNEYTDAKTDLAPNITNNNISIIEGKDGEVEIIVEKDQPIIFTILEAANIDGVQHLSSDNPWTRYTWFLLIAIFVCMCFYQIATQALMYWFTPIATNIVAAYPESVAFPVVAICNNNQFRLTYLTGANVQDRRSRNASMDLNSTNVFDRALENLRDMDAVKFLRQSAHFKARMILKCQWPNGTRCKTSDFKPVWTLTGLCWAINTDPSNPVHVTGAGMGNSLNLLLNVERYERIESCTPNFKTNSLPGVKILIYNQTDVPTSSIEGVNVPPGFTMDIPFRMQIRQKLWGRDCVNQLWHPDGTLPDFDSSMNVKACLIKSYLDKIEENCSCSMRGAFNSKDILKPCDVRMYFDCVVKVLQMGFDDGFNNFAKCTAPCDEVDYTAWQDMTELPNNIFPKLIDDGDDEDDNGDDNDLDENEWDGVEDEDVELYKCEHNQILDDMQVSKIKKEAHRAFEKQARFQEDILLRTQRLVTRMRVTTYRLATLRWGWHNDNFTSVHKRLEQKVLCYRNMNAEHPDTFNAIGNPQAQGEEKRARQLHQIVDARDFLHAPMRFKTIGDVKRVYGDSAERKWRALLRVEDVLRRLFAIYSESTFNQHLPKSLETMEKVLHYMSQYAKGQLQRRAWAEKMQARNLKHFFAEDFYESWFNLIVKEMEQVILKTIAYVEEIFPKHLRDNLQMDTELANIGSVLLFDDTAHGDTFIVFMADILECTLTDVRNQTIEMLAEFKKGMHDFQSAAENLFGKELPEYLHNFEFGPKFVQENFAQVNIFLHKMNVEKWMQEPTYSIWSLFCDIGGALGLFLGASLLTIIEVVYFMMQTKMYKKFKFWQTEEESKENHTAIRKPTRIHVHPLRKRRYFSFHGSLNGNDSFEHNYDEDQLRFRNRIGRHSTRTKKSNAPSASPSYQSVFETQSTASLIQEVENGTDENEHPVFPPRRKFGSIDVGDQILITGPSKAPIHILPKIRSNDIAEVHHDNHSTPPKIPPRTGNAPPVIRPHESPLIDVNLTSPPKTIDMQAMSSKPSNTDKKPTSGESKHQILPGQTKSETPEKNGDDISPGHKKVVDVPGYTECGPSASAAGAPITDVVPPSIPDVLADLPPTDEGNTSSTSSSAYPESDNTIPTLLFPGGNPPTAKKKESSDEKHSIV